MRMRECNSRFPWGERAATACLQCLTLSTDANQGTALHSKVFIPVHPLVLYGLRGIPYWSKQSQSWSGLSPGVLQIWEKRSDIEAGALVYIVNSTSFLLGSGIHYLFSSRIHSIFKRRAGKKHLKSFLKDFFCPLSNSLENMSFSKNLLFHKGTLQKSTHFSGRFALYIVNNYPGVLSSTAWILILTPPLLPAWLWANYLTSLGFRLTIPT